MFYPLHPLTVHLPLGLLLATVLFSLIALRSGDWQWEMSAYHCLIVGWLGCALAVASGLIDAARQLTGPEASRDADVLAWVNGHAIIGLGALLVFGRALLLRRRNPAILSDPRTRRVYLGLLLAGAALLLIGGWLGGQLVYRFGLGLDQ